MATLGNFAVGPAGITFAVGFIIMYGTYEVIHRRIHTHAPLNAWGEWARRHHLVHHHVAPKLNHGVTTSLWDHVFGTWKASRRGPRAPQAGAAVDGPRRRSAARLPRHLPAGRAGQGALIASSRRMDHGPGGERHDHRGRGVGQRQALSMAHQIELCASR